VLFLELVGQGLAFIQRVSSSPLFVPVVPRAGRRSVFAESADVDAWLSQAVGESVSVDA